jgi:hypothetical protein
MVIERTWTQSVPEIAGDFPWRPVTGWGPRMLGAAPRPWEWADVSIGTDDRIHLLGRGTPSTVVIVNPRGDLEQWWAWGEDEDDPRRLARLIPSEQRERRRLERDRRNRERDLRFSEKDRKKREERRERDNRPEKQPLSSRPHGITVAPDGRVAVVDGDAHVVRLFSPEGELLTTLGKKDDPADTGMQIEHPVPGWTVTVARSARPFNRPTKAAFAPDGSMYVSDGYGNARIHHFDPEGALIRSWGEPGIGPGEFMLPHAVLVRRDGTVVVADREADRLQVFTPEGEWLASFDDVRRPTAIAELPDGRLVVTELPWKQWEPTPRRGAETEGTPARIQVLSADGEVLGSYGNARIREEHDIEPGLLLAPHGVAVDARGDLYIAEVGSSFQGRPQGFTIQKFALP